MTTTNTKSESIADFCKRHKACSEGREWAIKHCPTMEAVWATARPDWLVWVATCKGVLTDRELRLFAVWLVRQIQHLLKDPRSLTALDVAERHANGQASDDELAAARAAACAAGDAAWVARAAAWAGGYAAMAKQAEWLRENCKPNFSRKDEVSA